MERGSESKRRIMLVFGTRPETIKLAPVIEELRANPRKYSIAACFTAQHREMCEPLLRFFSIKPAYDLDIMIERQSLTDIATRTMQRLDEVLSRDAVDMIVVQGDTTSAFAAALPAFYRRIPVAHVEAGLRTRDIWNPYPEEMNRQAHRWHRAAPFRADQTAPLSRSRRRDPARERVRHGQHGYRRAPSRAREEEGRGRPTRAPSRRGKKADTRHRAPQRELREGNRRDLRGDSRSGRAERGSSKSIFPCIRIPRSGNPSSARSRGTRGSPSPPRSNTWISSRS